MNFSETDSIFFRQNGGKIGQRDFFTSKTGSNKRKIEPLLKSLVVFFLVEFIEISASF
jgi:hypothetical protein